MPTRHSVAGVGAAVTLVALAVGAAEVGATGWDDAVAAFEAERYDEAARGFQAVVEASPKAPEGHYMLGRTLLELGRSAEAVASFTAARERGGGVPRYDLALARAQLAVHDPAGALATLGSEVPGTWVAEERALWGALLAGAANRAGGVAQVATVEAAVAALPDVPALWEALAALRRAGGDAAGSFTALLQAASLRPHDAALGRRAVKAGFVAAGEVAPGGDRATLYRQAAEVAERLAEEDPATELLTLAGEARLAAGDLEEAHRWSRAAAAADPGAALPRLDLGRVALAAGDAAAARRWLSEARARAGDDAPLLRRIERTLARALHRAGAYPEAAAAYRRAGDEAAAAVMEQAASAADANAAYDAARARCLARRAEVERLLSEAASVAGTAGREALEAEARRALATAPRSWRTRPRTLATCRPPRPPGC